MQKKSLYDNTLYVVKANEVHRCSTLLRLKALVSFYRQAHLGVKSSFPDYMRRTFIVRNRKAFTCHPLSVPLLRLLFRKRYIRLSLILLYTRGIKKATVFVPHGKNCFHFTKTRSGFRAQSFINVSRREYANKAFIARAGWFMRFASISQAFAPAFSRACHFAYTSHNGTLSSAATFLIAFT